MYAGSVAAKRRKVWYGVRTLFRLVAIGRPKNLDKAFDPTSTLVEERVVLFEGDSFEDAMKQAEDEANAYCERTQFVNIYSQSVKLKFLGAVDAFAISKVRPCAGTEVYSSTAIVSRSVSNSNLRAEQFGKAESRGAEARYKFVDGDILKNALAATSPRKPRRSGPRSAGEGVRSVH
jgi:hypothetical protein